MVGGTKLLRAWQLWNGRKENGYGREMSITLRVTTSLARERLKEEQNRDLERNRKNKVG